MYPLLLSIAIVMVVMSLQAMSLLESDMQKKKQVKEKRYEMKISSTKIYAILIYRTQELLKVVISRADVDLIVSHIRIMCFIFFLFAFVILIFALFRWRNWMFLRL